MPALATVANLSDDASATTIAAAAEHAEALIVVDNFEHVLDAGHVLVTITERVRHARTLVTSRTRLGVAGEVIVPIEPLATEAKAPQR